MTHEDKIIEEFKKAIGYQIVGSHPLPPLQNSDVVVGALMSALTTYRTQVLEEDRGRITEIIKDELKNAPLEVQMTKGMAFANVLKRIHPTN